MTTIPEAAAMVGEMYDAGLIDEERAMQVLADEMYLPRGFAAMVLVDWARTQHQAGRPLLRRWWP